MQSKRRNNKRNRWTNFSSNTVSNTTGIPDRIKVNLCYSDIIQVNPGLFRDTRIFRGNSLYDPDYTGTGHQPLYFDQYMAMYSKYRVLGSRCKVTYINNQGSSSTVLALVPSTEPVILTTYHGIREIPRAKATAPIPVAARYPFSLTSSSTTRVMCGLSSAEQWDEDWSGTSTTNPTQLWYWLVYIQTADGLQNAIGQLQVDIIYDCVFYDKVWISSSLSGMVLKDEKESRKDKHVSGVDMPPVCNAVIITSPPPNFNR